MPYLITITNPSTQRVFYYTTEGFVDTPAPATLHLYQNKKAAQEITNLLRDKFRKTAKILSLSKLE